MAEAKHTPGPWVVDRLSGSGRLQVNAPSSHTVATICHNVYIPEEVHAANARLIAAAPEMYEALDLLRQAWVTGPDTPQDAGQLHDLRERAAKACLDALEKARGEAS